MSQWRAYCCLLSIQPRPQHGGQVAAPLFVRLIIYFSVQNWRDCWENGKSSFKRNHQKRKYLESSHSRFKIYPLWLRICICWCIWKAFFWFFSLNIICLLLFFSKNFFNWWTGPMSLIFTTPLSLNNGLGPFDPSYVALVGKRKSEVRWLWFGL